MAGGWAALPGGDGWLVLAPADAAPLLLGEPAEITMTPLHDAVLAALDGGGALFFRALADRVGAQMRGDGESAAALGLTDQTLAAAIWDLVWAGRLTNDTLAPLRTVLSTGRPVAATESGPGSGNAVSAAARAAAERAWRWSRHGTRRPNGRTSPDAPGLPGPPGRAGTAREPGRAGTAARARPAARASLGCAGHLPVPLHGG